MSMMALTPQEFQHVIRVCQRVLINTQTAALDLKRFLVAHLSDGCPDTAARIEQFDDRQMEALRQGILQTLQADANSPLGAWSLGRYVGSPAERPWTGP